MDVTTSTTSTGQAAQSGQASTQAESDSSSRAISADFETFLKMLTVQMRNQDPLNPVEGTDFAVQLATFSTVEQQVRTNDLLGALGSQLGGLGFGQLLGWVGMEARTTAPVAFDGAPVDLVLPEIALADRAEMVVTNAQGVEVQRQSVPASGGELTWVAVDEDGDPLPSGVYTLTVEGYASDAMLGSQPVEHRADIVEARQTAQGTRLLLSTGQEIAAEEVIALRRSE